MLRILCSACATLLLHFLWFAVIGSGVLFLKYSFSDEYEEDMDCDTCSDELQGSDSEEDLYASDEGVVIPGSHGEMGTGTLLNLTLLCKPLLFWC
jgi:hypothetical protein